MKYKFAFVILVAGAALLYSQQQIYIEPPHDSGQGITPAYEGWFPNADGSFSLLFGYYNRNLKQELDIPIGPENHIDPGGPDQGQPTHFLTRRRWGMFTITVPKDFGGKKLTWTLVANGKTTQVPVGLDTLWELNPFKDASGDTPPSIGFTQAGPFVQGPRGQTQALSAAMANPVPLTVWVADDASVIPGATRPRTPAVTLTWSKFRGPGDVTFENDRPAIENAEVRGAENPVFSGKSSTTATFSEPGEYVLNVLANDWTGDGGRGFQCCWSNAQVKVSVKK
jgi:hypothetical protein